MRIFLICVLLPVAFAPLCLAQTASKQEWTLMSPVAEVQIEQIKITGRVADLNGKTIGLFWNGKPNGDIFLNEIGEQLKAKFETVNIVKMWEVKPETRTAFGNPAENHKFMAQNADVIIGASAD